MPQLVGTKCFICEQRIGSVLEGEFCADCGNPRHLKCKHSTQAVEGRCVTCGGEPNSAIARQVQQARQQEHAIATQFQRARQQEHGSATGDLSWSSRTRRKFTLLDGAAGGFAVMAMLAGFWTWRDQPPMGSYVSMVDYGFLLVGVSGVLAIRIWQWKHPTPPDGEKDDQGVNDPK
jgi:hypothetical protein